MGPPIIYIGPPIIYIGPPIIYIGPPIIYIGPPIIYIGPPSSQSHFHTNTHLTAAQSLQPCKRVVSPTPQC